MTFVLPAQNLGSSEAVLQRYVDLGQRPVVAETETLLATPAMQPVIFLENPPTPPPVLLPNGQDQEEKL